MSASTTAYALAAAVIGVMLWYASSLGDLAESIRAVRQRIREQTPPTRIFLLALVGAYLASHLIQWRVVARTEGFAEAGGLVALAVVPWLLTFAAFSGSAKGRLREHRAVPHETRALLAAALTAVLVSALWSYWRSNGYPLIMDEALYLFQARVFQGHGLARWLPNVTPPFVANEGVISSGGRFYSQYPPGWPAFLAFWPLRSEPWLLGPILVGVLVLATWQLIACFDRSASKLGALLLAANGFVLYWGATLLSDLPATTFGVLAAAGMGRAAMSTESGKRVLYGVIGGLSWSAVFAMRPLTAVALLPLVGAVMLSVRRPQSGPRALLTPAASAALGCLPLLVLVLSYNLATNGNALLFGYVKANGQLHALGYGTRGFVDYDSLGKPVRHTLQFGLPLAILGAARQLALLDTATLGGFLVPLVFLALSEGGLTKRGLILFVGSLALPVAHLAWFYTDCRYYLPLVPIMMIGAVLSIETLRPRLRGSGIFAGSLLAAGSLIFPVTAMTLDGFWPPTLTRNAVIPQMHAALEDLRARNDSTLVFVFERGSAAPVLSKLFSLNGENRSTHKLLVVRDLGSANMNLLRAMPGWSFACVDGTRYDSAPLVFSASFTCRDSTIGEIAARH